MKEPTIQVNDHGPYEIKGSFKLVNEAGDSFDVPDSLLLCRCGYSHDKPFCDGTHEKIDFENSTSENGVMVEV